jgi:hypothetical protein
MVWALLHPNMKPEYLGFLPSFLNDEDPRRAAEQFDANYHFGGWQPFGADKFKLTKDFYLLYPGDPPQEPLAMTSLRDEDIIVYESDIIVIRQLDGSFEVARLD